MQDPTDGCSADAVPSRQVAYVPTQAGVAVQGRQHIHARGVQTVKNNSLLDDFGNALLRCNSSNRPQAPNPLGDKAPLPIQNARTGDREVVGNSVMRNALGGAEDDAGAFTNSNRYVSGSSNGLKNGPF